MWEALHQCDLLVVQSMPPNSQPGFYLCTKHLITFAGAAVISLVIGIVLIIGIWQVNKTYRSEK